MVTTRVTAISGSDLLVLASPTMRVLIGTLKAYRIV